MSAIHRAHPRAAHAGLFRPPFAASQRDPESRAKQSAVLCRGFCGQDGRALLLPGPSRPRRGRAGKSPKGRAHEARAFAVRPGMACQRTSGASSRSRLGTMPKRPRPRGCLSLGYFSLGKQREVTRPPGWRTKTHRDVSRSSQNTSPPNHTPPISTLKKTKTTPNPNRYHPHTTETKKNHPP